MRQTELGAKNNNKNWSLNLKQLTCNEQQGNDGQGVRQSWIYQQLQCSRFRAGPQPVCSANPSIVCWGSIRHSAKCWGTRVNASATFQSVGWHKKQQNQWGTVECGKSHTKVCDTMWEGLHKQVLSQLGKINKASKTWCLNWAMLTKVDKWTSGWGGKGCFRQREGLEQRHGAGGWGS